MLSYAFIIVSSEFRTRRGCTTDNRLLIIRLEDSKSCASSPSSNTLRNRVNEQFRYFIGKQSSYCHQIGKPKIFSLVTNVQSRAIQSYPVSPIAYNFQLIVGNMWHNNCTEITKITAMNSSTLPWAKRNDSASIVR